MPYEAPYPRAAKRRHVASNQAEVAQARVPAAADDQMIVHRDTERLGGLDDVSGDGDVRLGSGGAGPSPATGILSPDSPAACGERVGVRSLSPELAHGRRPDALSSSPPVLTLTIPIHALVY